MWSAFLTGAAKQATTLIEERDKEIRDNMNIRMNEMYKRAEVAKKEAEERRDELTGLANELVGAGFDEREAAYLLQNPEQAKKIVAYADKTGGITAAKKQQLFSKNKEHLSALEGETPQEYIKRVTTLGRGDRPSLMAPGEMQGAFGLPSRAAERGMSEFLAKAGRTEEDLLATELPSRGVKPLGLDMTAFAEADTFSERKNAAQVALLEAEPGSDEFKQASSTLSRISAIEDIGKDSENKLKESDVRSNLRNLENTIKEQMAGPGNLVRIANPDGSFSYGYKKGLDPNVIKSIENSRQTAITSYLREFYSVRGEIPDVVRRAAAPFLVAPGTPVRVGGEQGGGRGKEGGAPAAPAGGLPSPKSQKEYDDLPSGARYIDTDGKVKIKS